VTTEEKADAAIREHIGYAMIASAIPIPIADILAVSAVQLDLVRQLAGLFEVKYDESWGKAMVAALSGSTIARAGASAVKAIPGVGWVVGAGAQAALSGASTYAIGQLSARHFRAGGTPDTFNPVNAERLYRDLVSRGEEIVEAIRSSAPVKSGERRVTDELERLTRLRESGSLTPDEFDRLKGRLLRNM
jgi:uncharacterized protein (DUF697 family)